MKVIVGILLILLIVIMVVLLSIVSYLLWDDVCETREKHRRTRKSQTETGTDCSWK